MNADSDRLDAGTRQTEPTFVLFGFFLSPHAPRATAAFVSQA
ncbi:hypothetical protein SynROS8604_03652 [Synechococcus sp. ROS8604]|nr:hypothetical protein SynROS8604_03652 [Synechococcus sp. ROS8604]